MPKKISECSRAHLINVPLPQHGSTYTVISHQFVIDYVHQALALAGFGMLHEEYRCTADGQIAQGIHKLNFNNDPELSMMFAWTNSYNKQIKFKCLVGAYIESTSTVMVSGEMGAWIRKHMGTADVETKQNIDEQIQNAHQYYNQMVSDKNEMVDKTLDIRKKAQLLGILFAEYGVLTTEQASIVRSYIDRPIKSFSNPDSLWAFYNGVTIALQQSHPRTWMEDQRVLHYFIDSIYKFPKHTTTAAIAPVTVVTPVEDEVVVEAEEKGPETDQEALEEIPNPNQINIFDVIEEEEEMAVCPPPAEIQIHIESDEEYAKRVAEIEGEPEEPEAEDEFAVEDNVDDVVVYTDPAGNTFEAPVVDVFPKEPTIDASDLVGTYTLDEMPAVLDKIQDKIDQLQNVEVTEPEKLSLDDILIRIPNEEKAKQDEEPDFSLDFSSSDDDEDSDCLPDLF
jgi:hypothetical protein